MILSRMQQQTMLEVYTKDTLTIRQWIIVLTNQPSMLEALNDGMDVNENLVSLYHITIDENEKESAFDEELEEALSVFEERV